MRFLNRHHFKNVDDTTGHNIEKRSIAMSDMHPAVTILQQLHIRGCIGVFQFQQMLLDDPAILLRQIVNVLQRSSVDVYFHGASLFSGLRIQDRCRAGRNLLLSQSGLGVQ